ncbi:hypothetical protein J4E91_007633 [Alternaria rosae]|nr:hypothetical protein J4E91_007633 [Alternaria rosae]
MAPPNTPFIYLLWHLYLEPIFALGGTYHLHWAPAEYFTFMPSTSAYHPDSQIAYDQLASAYLFFAFTEGVLMRVVKDRKTWWWIVLGLILWLGVPGEGAESKKEIEGRKARKKA